MTDNAPNPDAHDPTAQQWFDGGAPVPEDYVDPELVELGEAEDRIGFTGVLLLVVAFALFVGAQYTSELAYFFTPGDAIDLNEGSDDELMLGPGFVVDGQLAVPSNRFVSVVGVLERRSASEEHTFHKLVGNHVYVEQEIIDDRPRILQGTPLPEEPGADSYRGTYEGTGRIIAFEDLPRRYARFVEFYSDSYQVAFCGYEPSPELAQYFRRLRVDAEFRLTESLERTPTDEELADELGGATDCQQGYLLIAHRDPRSYGIFVLIYLVIVSITGGAGWLLARRWRS